MAQPCIRDGAQILDLTSSGTGVLGGHQCPGCSQAPLELFRVSRNFLACVCCKTEFELICAGCWQHPETCGCDDIWGDE